MQSYLVVSSKEYAPFHHNISGRNLNPIESEIAFVILSQTSSPLGDFVRFL